MPRKRTRTMSWEASSDYSKAKKYLRKLHTKKFQNQLIKYANLGVQALKDATPKDTGFTAYSWYSEVVIGEKSAVIYWKNSHIETNKTNGETYSIAVLIDVGHGLKDGTYVAARPYIQNALKPVLNDLNEAIKKEVLS